MPCHLVSVLGCEVQTSRWMLALQAHAGGGGGFGGREVDFDGFLSDAEALSCLLGSSPSVLMFFVFPNVFLFLNIYK